MKKEIHPPFYETKITCACGESFSIGSTKKELNVEICSKCHPFYTGKKNVVDSTGRVERFKKMREKTETIAEQSKKSAGTAKKRTVKKATTKKKKTLKELKSK